MTTKKNSFIKSFAQLKADSRGSYIDHFGALTVITMIFVLINGFFPLLISSFSGTANLFALLLNLALLTLLNMTGEVLRYGIQYCNIIACSGGNPKVSDLFIGFQKGQNQIISVASLLAALTVLCQLPYVILDYIQINYFPENTVMGSVTLILMPCCILLYCVIYLNYTMTYYLMMDIKGITAKEALKMSSWIMKGHKWRYFLLTISFFPLLLIGVFACGIGLYFVFAYQYATFTHFYLNLTNAKTKQKKEL